MWIACGCCRAPRRGVTVAGIVVLALAVSGCGASTSKRHAAASTNSKGVSVRDSLSAYPSPHDPVLASLKLPGGGVARFVAVPCSERGKTRCYQLGEYNEQPPKYGPGRVDKRGLVRSPLDTGPTITSANVKKNGLVLNLTVSRYCEAGHSVAEAAGILIARGATVIDRAKSGIRRLRKASIPKRLHSEGTLVYGLLLPGPNELIVRAPDRHILESRSWPGADEKGYTSQSCRAQLPRRR